MTQLIGPTSNHSSDLSSILRVLINYLFIYVPRLFGATPQDRHKPSDIFKDFHLGRCPISSPSHTSIENGEFTSQSTRTRLDAIQCAYECKTYEFSWFMHNYISSQYDSIPCNHHVNTSILHALTYNFSHSIHAIQFKQYHASNAHGQF